MAMQYAHAVLKIGVRTDVLERQLSAIASDGHSGLVQNNGWMVSSTPASCEEHQELENDTASDKSSSLFTRLAMLEDSALKSCTLFDHVDSISQRLCSLESAIRTPSRCRVPPSLVPTRLHGDVRNKTTTVQHPVRYKSAPDDVNTEKLTPHGVTEHSDCKAVQEESAVNTCAMLDVESLQNLPASVPSLMQSIQQLHNHMCSKSVKALSPKLSQNSVFRWVSADTLKFASCTTTHRDNSSLIGARRATSKGGSLSEGSPAFCTRQPCSKSHQFSTIKSASMCGFDKTWVDTDSDSNAPPKKGTRNDQCSGHIKHTPRLNEQSRCRADSSDRGATRDSTASARLLPGHLNVRHVTPVPAMACKMPTPVAGVSLNSSRSPLSISGLNQGMRRPQHTTSIAQVASSAPQLSPK